MEPCSHSEERFEKCDVFSWEHLQPFEHSGAQKEKQKEALCAAESGGFQRQWPRVERPDVGSQSLGRYVGRLHKVL